MKRDQIESILKSGFKGSMIITGGGTGAINELLKYGGGSKFLLSAHIPYSKNAFISLTAREKDYVGLDACKELATAALHNAIAFVDEDFQNLDEPVISYPLIGLACTAKLTYDGERDGRNHEAFIGIGCHKDGNQAYHYSRVTFPAGSNREEQEKMLADAILGCLFVFTCTNHHYLLPKNIKEAQLT